MDRPEACKDDNLTFTAGGTADSGGRQRIVCKDAEGATIRDEQVTIPPGAVTYEFTVSGPTGVIKTGKGSSVTIKAGQIGSYSATFTASSKRDCPPGGITLPPGSATVVDRGSFTQYGGAIDLPNFAPVVGRLQTLLNYIPGCTIRLESTTVGLTQGARDCCKSGAGKIANGERFSEGGVSISGKGSFPVWPIPPVSIFRDLDWGFSRALVEIKAGVFVDAEIAFLGNGGYRTDECLLESCGYAEIGADFRIIPNVTVKVVACAQIFGSYVDIADIEVTPASIIIPLSGRINYNSKEDCNGLNCSLGLGDVTFRAGFKVGGVGLEYQAVIITSKTLTCQ